MQHRRVAVFRTGYLGDTVCAIPAFRLIRGNFPDAHLTFITERPVEGKAYSGEIAEELGIFDSIKTYAPGSTIGAALSLSQVVRRGRSELLIMLPQRVESPRKLRLKRTFLHLTGNCEVWGESFSPVVDGERLSEPHRMVAMLHHFGLKGDKPQYAIPLRSEARDSVIAKLCEIDVSASFIAFCGGGKGAVKKWSLDSYAAVISDLASFSTTPIVAVGTASELAAYSRLSTLPNFHILKGPLSFPEIVELMRMASCYIGNDTGPMHVAAAVNTPVAVVMSAHDEKGCWYPDVQPRLIIRRDVPCQGCLLKECIEMKHVCMTGITPEHVLSQLLPFLRLTLPLT